MKEQTSTDATSCFFVLVLLGSMHARTGSLLQSWAWYTQIIRNMCYGTVFVGEGWPVWQWYNNFSTLVTRCQGSTQHSCQAWLQPTICVVQTEPYWRDTVNAISADWFSWCYCQKHNALTCTMYMSFACWALYRPTPFSQPNPTSDVSTNVDHRCVYAPQRVSMQYLT